MNRKALVAAPIVAGIAIIVVVLLSRNGQGGAGSADGAGARPGATAGTLSAKEAAALRAEIDALREEAARLRGRAEAAEAALAKGGAAPAEDPKERIADWRSHRGAAFLAKVKAVDWKKATQALIDYWKEMEAAKAEGRPVNMNADLIAQLTLLNKHTVDLALALGLQPNDAFSVFANELVAEQWNDGMVASLAGGTLSEQQAAALRGTALYSPPDPEGFKADGNPMAGWERGLSYNLRLLTDTRGILTPEQYERLSGTVAPDFMLSLYANFRQVQLDVPPGGDAGSTVSKHWMQAWKLPESQSAVLNAVAGDYARQVESIMRTYGDALTPERALERHLKLLDAQRTAEARLAKDLTLTEEERQRVLKGSGSMLHIGYSR